jgi:hypothetical protein
MDPKSRKFVHVIKRFSTTTKVLCGKVKENILVTFPKVFENGHSSIFFESNGSFLLHAFENCLRGKKGEGKHIWW